MLEIFVCWQIWRLQDNAENKLTEEGTVYCIASVARIKWRPEKKSHIASCSQVVDQAVCVWDIRRPYMPFAVFEEHKDMATGSQYFYERSFSLWKGREKRAKHLASKYNMAPTVIAVVPGAFTVLVSCTSLRG